MSMSEARVVLPLGETPDGNSSDAAHAYIRGELLTEFHGYTSFRGEGAWRSHTNLFGRHDYIEPVMIYDIAMADTLSNCALIQSIARHAGELADQQSVYVRLPNGAVYFVEPQTSEHAQ